MNSLTNNSAGNSAQQQPPKDYVDKGLEAAEKKYGGEWGQNTEKNRAVNEKITDGARGVFEKVTGKKVPEKISN